MRKFSIIIASLFFFIVTSSCINPTSWTKYEIDGSFYISVPPTVELRHEYDIYTKQLSSLGFNVNKDAVIFQQKNLSQGANDNHYCRIILQHFVDNNGDYSKSDEQEYIGNELRSFLLQMVNDNLVNEQQLIGSPTFEWIKVDEKTYALKTDYRRTGNSGHTTHVSIYLLQNYNEMVQMTVSYREQEKEQWMPDLGNVIKTFKWKNQK